MTTGATLDTLPAGRSYIQSLRDAGTIGSAQRGEVFGREGDAETHVLLVSAGYVVAVKHTSAGHQQNVALYVPGDLVGHQGFTLGTSRCGAIALTDVSYHRVSHARLRDLLGSSGDFSEMFWRHVAFHGVMAQEWLVSLGRRTAYARTAHLLCEIIYRTSPTDTAERITCQMPLTQTELADTLGLSVVHVNRTLMRLREEGLIRLRRGQVDVLDWPRFKEAAGFDPTYLRVMG